MAEQGVSLCVQVLTLSMLTLLTGSCLFLAFMVAARMVWWAKPSPYTWGALQSSTLAKWHSSHLLSYHSIINPSSCAASLQHHADPPKKMGAIANAVYSNNGNVFGIIPRALMDYERKPNEVSAISVNGIDQAIKKPDLLSEASDKSRSVFWPVKTMHQRKQWV